MKFFGVSALEEALKVFGYEEIRDIWSKTSLLTILRAALANNEYDSRSLQERYGLSMEEIRYLWEKFPELKVNKKPSRATISNVARELEGKLREKSAKMLSEIELWIFPKWRELVGAVYLGMFEGRVVKNILWSAVALLIPSVRDIFRYKLLSGEECVGLFGLGAYVCEFVPERARESTTYCLPIHGVIMETPLYERAISSRKILVIPKFADYVREHLVRIPLYELAGSKFAPRFFGPAIRKTNKIIIQFLKAIKSSEIANADVDNLTLLSAWRGAYNKFLVSEKHIGKLSVAMLKGVPGVVGYEGVLNKLEELPPVHESEVFKRKARLLWMRFSISGFDLLEQFLG